VIDLNQMNLILTVQETNCCLTCRLVVLLVLDLVGKETVQAKQLVLPLTFLVS
jgi:hypothetical protein